MTKLRGTPSALTPARRVKQRPSVGACLAAIKAKGYKPGQTIGVNGCKLMVITGITKKGYLDGFNTVGECTALPTRADITIKSQKPQFAAPAA